MLAVGFPSAVTGVTGVTEDPFASRNLLESGGFEGPDGALPPGWDLFSGATAHVATETGDRARTGDGFVQFDTRGRADGEPRVRLRTSGTAPATGGETYRLQYWVRVDESSDPERKSIEARLLFYDANDQPIDRLYTAFGSTRGLPSLYWRLVQEDVKAPPDAHHMRVDLNAFAAPEGSFVGVVGVDDMAVFELSRAELYVDPAAGMRAYHIVAPGVEPVPGFIAVPHDRVVNPTDPNDFGWNRSATRFTHRPAGYPTQLQGYPVFGRRLTLPIPAGRYRVSLYMGVLWRTTIDQMNHRVRFSGQVVPEVDEQRSFDDLMDQEYFAYDQATLVRARELDLGPLSVYRGILGRQFRRHDFDVTIPEGGLDIDLDGGALAAVLLTPIEESAAHQAAVAALELGLEAEFVSTWGQLLRTRESRGARIGSYAPEEPDYVLFKRSWMRAVEHDSRPDESEVVFDELRVVATPGEYEPVTVSIWPRRDLESVRLIVSDLVAEDGSRLPASTVRTWYLQQKTANLGVPATAYRVEGHFLPDWGVRDLYAEVVQRAWLSARVPRDASPGLYRGSVFVSPVNAATTRIELVLEVLPFELERPERVHSMTFAGGSTIVPYPAVLPVDPGDVRNKNYYRGQALDHLRELGLSPEFAPPDLNCPADSADSVIDWDRNSTDGPRRHLMEMIVDSSPPGRDWLWVDVSHDQSCLIDAFDERVTEGWTVADVERYLSEVHRFVHEEYGFGKIYLHVSAEETAVIGDPVRTQAWIDYLDFVRARSKQSWPAYVTVHTANSEAGQPVALAHADIVALGMFHGVNRTDARVQLVQAVATGNPYLFYGARGRFVPGYYLWRTGGNGSYHAFYSYYYGGAVNNDWDNGTLDVPGRRVGVKSPPGSGAHYSDTGRMIGSWFSEEIREGIDDDAYLHTLERWVERTAHVSLTDGAFRGAAESKSALADARATADRIAERISVSVDPHHLHDGLYRPIEPETFDAWRSEVIEAIRVLQTIDGIFEWTHARGRRRHALRCLFPNEHAHGRRSRRSCDRFASAGARRL